MSPPKGKSEFSVALWDSWTSAPLASQAKMFWGLVSPAQILGAGTPNVGHQTLTPLGDVPVS